MHAPARTSAGFTLVELIVVIILIGILSAYAASRFIGVSSFSAYTAREQAISIIRQIQLSRMQSNLSPEHLLSNGYYTLMVTPDCLGSVASCLANSDDSRSDVLRGDELSFTVSVTLDNQSLSFDLLGIAGFVELGSRGYVDSVARQRIQTQAQFVLEKMTREIRHVIPNSLAISSDSTQQCLSFYPIVYAGVYALDGTDNRDLNLLIGNLPFRKNENGQVVLDHEVLDWSGLHLIINPTHPPAGSI